MRCWTHRAELSDQPPPGKEGLILNRMKLRKIEYKMTKEVLSYF